MAKASDRQYYTVPEAARFLDVSPSTVWRWIQAQKLPAYRVGPKNIRIRKGDLETLIRPVRVGRQKVTVAKGKKEGQLYLPGPEEVQDIWANYDPQRVRRGLQKSAGALAGADRDPLLTDIHTARQQMSHGRPA